MGEAARMLDVTLATLRRWEAENKIIALRTPGGHRRFERSQVLRLMGVRLDAPGAGSGTGSPPVEAHYVRVSGSSGQEGSLAQQRQLLASTAHGDVVAVYSDRASGLSEKRPGLQRLLRDAAAGRFALVRVTHKDRLARFGVGWLEQLLNAHGVALEVLDDERTKSPHEELLADFMSLVASFSGRLYRLRGHADQRKLLTRASEVIDGAAQQRASAGAGQR